MKRGLRRYAAAGLGVVIAGLSGATAAASSGTARATPREPFRIRSASLVQQGQQLVWRVHLVQAFSPAGLGPGRRSLCLLIEHVRSGKVEGQVCVLGHPRGAREARLAYVKMTGDHAGPRLIITASVDQPNSSTLVASFLPSAIGLGYRPMRWQTISTLRAAACAPPGSGSGRKGPNGGCFELSPAKPALLKLHVPMVVGCRAAGRSVVYDGPSNRREIALTFDDGPWGDPPTAQFLQVLEREHVPATFFEIGRQIPEFDPQGTLERRMLMDGDMIGDHTWSHPNMTRLKPARQRAELKDTAAAIEIATGFTPCLWRPPYGAINSKLVSVARSLGLLTIMWDVDPRDWSMPGVGAIYSNIVAHAHNGAIVIQHVGGGPRQQTLAALPREIETLRAKGYRFVTVDQLLGLQLLYR